MILAPLPAEAAPLAASLAPAFTTPTFRHVRLLLVAAVLATGLAVSAVRYYERAGLLPPPYRSGRQVRYPATAITRINSVRHAQEAGLTLSEIRELTVLGELLQQRPL